MLMCDFEGRPQWNQGSPGAASWRICAMEGGGRDKHIDKE